MKLFAILLCSFFLSSGSIVCAESEGTDIVLHDPCGDKSVPLQLSLPDLVRKHRIILIGEQHDQMRHHQAQLRLIAALHAYGTPVSIGLEMFRTDSQGFLDQWSQGAIDEVTFLKTYYDNWKYSWHFYREIFQYAKEKHIHLVGLSAPEGIINQVAMAGFKSLSPEQRDLLPEWTCHVDEHYMGFIKKAYGLHAHGKMDFRHFCEAQLVRDTTMALTALDYVRLHPRQTLVILTGREHARKNGGIPYQIESRSNIVHTVIFPEIRLPVNPEKDKEKDKDDPHPARLTDSHADYILWIDTADESAH